MNIDKRKSYFLLLDTETANGLDFPLVYDIGYAVIDKKGNVYESNSLTIYEVFRGERELMQSAYYANKIPMYEKELQRGERDLVRYETARKLILKACEKYGVKAIIAHNMRFDYKSTNTTIRYLTKSVQRYFLPFGVPVWCTLTMAQDTICKSKAYRRFCEKNAEERIYRGKVRATAEILYQYITGDNDFKEAHTGLADVLIEKEIFVKCLRQHKKMRRSPWKMEKEIFPQTEMQKRINTLAHYQI